MRRGFGLGFVIVPYRDGLPGTKQRAQKVFCHKKEIGCTVQKQNNKQFWTINPAREAYKISAKNTKFETLVNSAIG